MSKNSKIPFDFVKLDKLLSVREIDALIVTSKHNIQYLMGGYRYFFFENFDALGISRYLPVFLYTAGSPEQSLYLGNEQETAEAENQRFWCRSDTGFWTTTDIVEVTIQELRQRGLAEATIGIEFPFMPADSMDLLRARLPGARFVEAHRCLEQLRAVKTLEELDRIRNASELVVDSMVASFAAARPGLSKQDLFDLLRREEISRNMTFDFCQLTMGTGFNRAPNETQILKPGDIVSLDSGGSFGGYFGDLCRMGVVGEPDRELRNLLQFIDDIQHCAREPIRDGAIGRRIYDVADEKLATSAMSKHISFVAHGMGIIGHEAPRLSARGPVSYPADDADQPLREGMVVSIETTLTHPERGFIKLEDTVAVTADGCVGYGDHGRGWNIIPA